MPEILTEQAIDWLAFFVWIHAGKRQKSSSSSFRQPVKRVSEMNQIDELFIGISQ